MNFETKKDGDILIFTLKEKKLDSSISSQLKAEFLLLCKTEKCSVLVIDLKSVQFCDSSGLSALLIAQRTMNSKNGEVRIANLNKSIENLMKISQLDRIFKIYKSTKSAIKG
ncbi:MAG: hypothetical protein IGBAC_0020 [Ignavibacteriae bacterium]|nr:MAG: hypothetical protein IGBAC_0020 [Ignavibacteriota bacterium]